MVRRTGIAGWVYTLNEELVASLSQRYQIIYDLDKKTGLATAIYDNGTMCQINKMGEEQFFDSRKRGNNDCEIPPENCTMADHESCNNPKAECLEFFNKK